MPAIVNGSDKGKKIGNHLIENVKTKTGSSAPVATNSKK
jgi:hypothetical protein